MKKKYIMINAAKYIFFTDFTSDNIFSKRR